MKKFITYISRQVSPQKTMRRTENNQWAKIVVSGMLGLTTLSLGACSTTAAKQTSAAPIAYKADQGKFQNASIRQPYSGSQYTSGRSTYTGQSVNRTQGNRQNVPSTVQPYNPNAFSTAPKTAALPQPTPRSAPTARNTVQQTANFDASSVDRDLYKHQRVGKRYTIMGKSYTPKHQPFYDVSGVSSWYGDKFHGRPTATGELYDMDDLTAAHKTLPLNSMVYVTNLETGKGMMVRVNDRGPFVDDRIIDLSRATARALGMFESGLGKVRVQYAGPADPMAAKTNKTPIKRPSTPQVRRSEKSEHVAERQQPQYRAQPRQKQNMLPKAKEQNLSELSPKYTPLRDLGLKTQPSAPSASAPAQQASLPQADTSTAPELGQNTGSEYKNPLLGYETTPNMTAPQIGQATPQHSDELSEPNTEDGPITLTIKGPIHMASDKTVKGQSKAKFIPAVNYTTRKSSSK